MQVRVYVHIYLHVAHQCAIFAYPFIPPAPLFRDDIYCRYTFRREL